MSYQNSIRWAWENTVPPNGPQTARCINETINGAQRGQRSAHDCVVECITEWVRNRDFKTALLWLTKGAQCHNPAAQAELNEAGGKAVRYAVETYGIEAGYQTQDLGIEGLAA